VIFSPRRKPGPTPIPAGRRAVVLIASADLVFRETIAKILEQWGFACLPLGDDSELDHQEAEGGEVVLVDIREVSHDAFGQVYAIRQQYPAGEVVLINRADNVAASIAGMKAGAVDEVIVPVDTGALRSVITEACARLQALTGRKVKKPLLARLSEAMMAATFAQAGDFAGALDMLDRPSPPQNDQSTKKKHTK
jgi:DNA-binding NtrC family response regulator